MATGSLRYAEAALKLATTIGRADRLANQAEVSKFAILALANIKFIKGQLAKITVKGLFDEDTAKLYDQVANNPSIFNNEVCENIKTASLIVGAKHQFSRPRGGFHNTRRAWKSQRERFL